MSFFVGHGSTTPLLDANGKRRFRRWLFWRVPLFEFQNDPADPLTFYHRDVAYQPDNHTLDTDGGSTPPFLWAIPGLNPWAFPRAYPCHDSGFRYGGLYVRRSGEPEFRFRLLSREDLNNLLTEMVLADDGSHWDAGRIRVGVALGSRWCWDEPAQAHARAQAGIVIAA